MQAFHSTTRPLRPSAAIEARLGPRSLEQADCATRLLKCFGMNNNVIYKCFLFSYCVVLMENITNILHFTSKYEGFLIQWNKCM